MAALLEDATPLQLGAEGAWRGTHFAVVGRLRVRIRAGGRRERAGRTRPPRARRSVGILDLRGGVRLGGRAAARIVARRSRFS